MGFHSQALTIKLKPGNENLSLQDIEAAIAGHNDWCVRVLLHLAPTTSTSN